MQTNGLATRTRDRLDGRRVKRDFPVLRTRYGDKPLVYLDTAASAQKPKVVSERVYEFCAAEYAKTKTPYRLGKEATEAYEASRAATAKFLNARKPEEIVFVRNTTEGINLVAKGFARGLLKKGDEVLISEMEHHSNIVPWHMACEQTGARLVVARLNKDRDIDVNHVAGLLGDRTKLVAVTHVSNVLGGRQPVEEIVELAHERGVPVLVDGAQAAPHTPVDVRAIGCDFYVFSGHKTYGPSGVGAVYGTAEWLEKLPETMGGEPMAADVTFEGYTPMPVPEKFSAGVPALASTISLQTALEYLTGLGRKRVEKHVAALAEYATAELKATGGVHVLGDPAERVSVVSFTLKDVEAEQAAEYLDRTAAVAVRGGHLSCRPLMRVLGVEGAVRASFGVYNTPADVEAMVEAVRKCLKSAAKKARNGH